MEVSFEKVDANGAQPAASPIVDVEATVIVQSVPTPVAGVTVETVTTVAPPAPAPVAAPAASPAPPIDLTPVAAIPTSTAVVPAAPAPSVPAITDSPIAFDDENIGFEDVILPRINIVQKVGDLSNIFNCGEVVLNQSEVIYEPPFVHPQDPTQNSNGTGPLFISILGFRKRQFTEKVDGGKLGLLLNSEADIPKHNGTLDYKEWQASVEAAKLPGATTPAKRYFQRLATALLLVKKPAHIKDEDHVSFPYDHEGEYFALVLWSMKGTAYTHGAKHFFTARKIGHLRKGYVEQSWTLGTKLEDFKGNFASIPIVKAATKNSDSFKAFARSILTGGN